MALLQWHYVYKLGEDELPDLRGGLNTGVECKHRELLLVYTFGSHGSLSVHLSVCWAIIDWTKIIGPKFVKCFTINSMSSSRSSCIF